SDAGAPAARASPTDGSPVTGESEGAMKDGKSFRETARAVAEAGVTSSRKRVDQRRDHGSHRQARRGRICAAGGARELLPPHERGLVFDWSANLTAGICYAHLFGGDVVRAIFSGDHADFGFVEVTLTGIPCLGDARMRRLLPMSARNCAGNK